MVKAKRQTFLVCVRCGGATVHTLLASEESDYRLCDVEGYFGHEPATYHLFRCDGCTCISLYIWSAFHSPHSEFGEREHPVRFADQAELPAAVRLAYREADRVKNHSNAAYAVLARKVLEVIAKERGISDRNLSRALSMLAEKGAIPPILAEAATLIRIFGNAGAHPGGEEINGWHVEMIDQFLELLVQYLYVAPAALHQFKCFLGINSNGKPLDS